MLNAIVIDDECYARQELTALLQESLQVNVIGDAANAILGLQLINQLKPDVVFLDIQMPQVTGIELLSMLDPETMPFVVFVTAYDEFALQAFEDNAFDYLLKPVDPLRLKKTLTRLMKLQVQSQVASQIEPEIRPDYSPLIPELLEQVPCTGHNRILLLATADIECAFSDLTGVSISTGSQQACSQLSLKILEDKTTLFRCHRQYLVNLKAIKEIQLLDNNLAEIITLTGRVIPVSRRYLKALKQSIGIQ